MTYSNGDVYDGQWEHNCKVGIGKLIYTGKGTYYGKLYFVYNKTGHFSNGKRHGEGLFSWPNKDRYSGDWKNGHKHGTGTYIIDEVGLKLTGEWFEGNLLNGTWTMANGSKYQG